MMNKYPFTIDNGHGERLTFKGINLVDSIQYLEVENEISPGAGPPLHVHFQQEESLTILEGKAGVEIMNEGTSFHEVGETIQFSKGIVHRFWNAGEVTMRCRGQVWPAHNFEYFITEIFRSMKASGNGKPAPFDAAYLMKLFRSEFEMAAIPTFVRTVVFPVIIFAGKVVGKHRKFENAPQAILQNPA